MKLEDLKKLGGIITTELKREEVTVTTVDNEGVPQTYTFDVFVKRLSFGDYEKLAESGISEVKAESESGEAKTEVQKRKRQAAIISVCARIGDTGEEEIPYECAYQMDMELGTKILNAIFAVQGNYSKKRLPQATSSGTN